MRSIAGATRPGVTAYRELGHAGPVRCGEQRPIAGARVFVVPNPSGLNASFPGFEDKLVWFKALREFVDRVAPRRADRASARRPARRP